MRIKMKNAVSLNRLLTLLFLCISAPAFAQWVPINSSPNAQVNSLAFFNGYLYAATDIGVFRSSDNGDTWQYSDSGTVVETDSQGTSNFPIRTFAYKNDTLYAAGDYGGNGTPSGFYYSTNNGASWQYPTNYDISARITCLALSGDTIFAGSEADAGTGGGVQYTTDNGDYWFFAYQGLTNKNILSLLIFNGYFFAGSYDSGVYVSTNRGVTWSPSRNGIPDSLYVSSLVANGGIIYAGTSSGETFSSGVFRSTDNGAHWEAWDSLILQYDLDITSLLATNNYLFAGADQDAYLLKNNDAAWYFEGNFTDGNNNYFGVHSLAASDTFLFLETGTGVLFRRALSDFSAPVPKISLSTDSIYINLPANSLDTFLFKNIGDTTLTTSVSEDYGNGEVNFSYPDTTLPDSTGKVFIDIYGVKQNTTILMLITTNDPLRLYDTVYLIVRVSTPVIEAPLPNQISFSIFPNPFSASTTISYTLPTEEPVTLTVYNALGQAVAVLANAREEAGNHTALFTAAGLQSGVYFYRLTAGRNVQTGTMAVVK